MRDLKLKLKNRKNLKYVKKSLLNIIYGMEQLTIGGYDRYLSLFML